MSTYINNTLFIVYGDILREMILQKQNITTNLTLIHSQYGQLNLQIVNYVSRLITECNLLRNDPRRDNSDTLRFMYRWCEKTNKYYFSTMYFILWQNSVEKFISQQVLGSLVTPILTFISLAILLCIIPLLIKINKIKFHPLWFYLLWNNCINLIFICFEIIPSWAINNLGVWNFKHNVVACKLHSFISNIFRFAPNFVICAMLVEQTMARWQQKLYVSTYFASKAVLVAIFVCLFYLNIHTIWLYDNKGSKGGSENPKDCKISAFHDPFFKKGYTVILISVHSTLTLTIVLICLFCMWWQSIANDRSFTDEQRVSVSQGCLFVVFQLPALIYWHIENDYRDNYMTQRNFNNFKQMTLIGKIISVWLFLRYLAANLGILLISTVVKDLVKKFIENVLKLVQCHCERRQDSNIFEDNHIESVSMDNISTIGKTCICNYLPISKKKRATHAVVNLLPEHERNEREPICSANFCCCGGARIKSRSEKIELQNVDCVSMQPQ